MLVGATCFGRHLIVAPLVQLLFISLTQKQLEMIKNTPLCYLTDKVNIPDV